MAADQRYRNLPIRKARRMVLAMGGAVSAPNRTGEIRFYHPLQDCCITTSASRRTAHKTLICWVREIEDKLAELRLRLDALSAIAEQRRA